MSVEVSFKSGLDRRERLLLVLAVLIGLAERLPLIDAAGILPADGLRLAVWSITLHDKALPLYPLLLQALRPLAGNAQLAGGLVAALLGAWAAVPLYRLLAERAGRLAGALAVLITLGSLHCIALSAGVVPNPALIVPLLYAWLYWGRLPRARATDLAWFNLCCGLAALARPEGWALILAAAWANWRFARLRGVAAWAKPALCLAVPCALLAGWFVVLGHSGYAGEFFGYSLSQARPAELIARFVGYGAALLGHVFVWWFAFAAGAWAAALVRPAPWRKLAVESLVVCAVLLGALSIQWAADLHRLLTPAVYAAIVAAALALSALLTRLAGRRPWLRAAWGALALLLALSAAISLGILGEARRDLQGVFEDRLRAWQQAAAQGRGRLLSDLPLEAGYYTGRPFERYNALSAQAGDTLALHSTERCLDQEARRLVQRFDVRELGRHAASRDFRYGPANAACADGSDPGSRHVSLVLGLQPGR